jgi:AcrR family transcriptional regulator
VGLSLRGVARQLEMAPSALYRYFASRDELLTELIVDAYHSLADAMESAVARAADDLERWMAAMHAMRRWAFERPHEWALLYGSPVPGYHAPERTVPAAVRIPLVFSGIVEAAAAAGHLSEGSDPQPSAQACAGVALIGEALPTTLSAAVIVRVLVGWEQVAGAISLELFGHFSGGLSDPDAVFQHVAYATAIRNGLPPAVA